MTACIVVCPTYNNRSSHDSYDYELAIRLTAFFPRELVHDLMRAVAASFSTYGSRTTFKENRSNRVFAGLSMGSVQTWRVFEQCLDVFAHFMPSSGNLTSDGTFFERIVERSGYGPEDFSILAMSGTNDFAREAFSYQIKQMEMQKDFIKGQNIAYLEKKGYGHNHQAAIIYFYNSFIKGFPIHSTIDSCLNMA